jgi:hypothetical protein
MKRLIINILPLLAIICSLSSCLKGYDTNLDTDNTNSVIEFANTGSIASGGNATYHRFSSDLGVLNSGDSATFNVNIHYAGADYAPTDITVNLELDTAALSSYNESDDKSYVVPPTSIYNFPSSVVIKKGTLMSQIKVTVVINPAFDYNVDYALPLKIASVSTGIIGSNYGTCIYSFSIRNNYDGVYNIKGYILREADTVLSGFYKDYEVNLLTAGVTAVQYDRHPWANNTNVGGIDGLTLTIDQTTNKVKVSSVTNPAVTNTPGYDSRYDPDTKTFFVSYYWGTGPTNRAAIDTLTYIGPR